MLRAILTAAKVALVLLFLGGAAMAFLAKEVGPWVFGVFPAVMILGAIIIALSRSMRLQAAMRSATEEEDGEPASHHPE